MDPEMVDYIIDFPRRSPPQEFLDLIAEFARDMGPLCAASYPTQQLPSSYNVGESTQGDMMDCGEKNKKTWEIGEEKMLIVGVVLCGNECGIRWKEIKDRFFPNSTRTPEQLKCKYRHMKNAADKQIDEERKKLYLRARELDDRRPKDGRSGRGFRK